MMRLNDCAYKMILLGTVLLIGCAHQKEVALPRQSSPLREMAPLVVTPPPAAMERENIVEPESSVQSETGFPLESDGTYGQSLAEVEDTLDKRQSVGESSAEPVDAERTGSTTVDIALVEKRLQDYADKLALWERINTLLIEAPVVSRPDFWSECLERVRRLFIEYRGLAVMEDPQAVSAATFHRVLRDDFLFLEGQCGGVLDAGQSRDISVSGGSRPSRFIPADDAIMTLVAEGRYGEVVSGVESLRNGQTGQILSPRLARIYALALAKTGQLERAVVEIMPVLSAGNASEELALQRQMADFLLATARTDEAMAQYRQVANFFEDRRGDDRWVTDQLTLLGQENLEGPAFSLYRNILSDYLAFGEHHVPPGIQDRVMQLEREYPESLFAYRGRELLTKVENQAREWVIGRLAEIKPLQEAKEYALARAVLERMILAESSPALLELIQQALDEVVLAEILDQQEQERILARTLADQWDAARRLAESQRYDEAIAGYLELYDTEYDLQARAKVGEVAEAAATEMRRQAAGLFVKARKVTENGRKRELLRETWLLLDTILNKYPQVSLADKVKQNLENIEKQIVDFDPGLLNELHSLHQPSPVAEEVSVP
ncbi:MAG: hypothetical protein KJ950_16500 [Proteobacteria bacterium]|nr:hypothetical protein [Pseudomonadota bacterium]MBU1686185.1 hypothetical protein [Pseudomonadota bacterium]